MGERAAAYFTRKVVPSTSGVSGGDQLSKWGSGHSRGTTIATLARSQLPLWLALTSTNSRSTADLLAESVRPAPP